MLIGILCGNTDFDSVHETDDDPEFFCNAFHMRHIPSEPTLRQRMDEIGASMQGVLRQINTDLFKTFGIEPSALENGYVPVDIDVSPSCGSSLVYGIGSYGLWYSLHFYIQKHVHSKLKSKYFFLSFSLSGELVMSTASA